jgi:hypothetical protein
MSYRCSINFLLGQKKKKTPLVWWSQHVMQFSCVFFLACQILCIVGSQSDIESSFNVVGLITSLQQSKLEIENFDHMIFIAKKLAC